MANRVLRLCCALFGLLHGGVLPSLGQATSCSCCPGPVPTDPAIPISLADLNNDGYADTVIAHPFDNDGTGVVHVASGSDGSVLWSFYGGPNVLAFGLSVYTIQDLTSDGIDEIAIGMIVMRPQGTASGRVLVVDMASRRVLWVLDGGIGEPGDHSLIRARAVTDLNGDESIDLLDAAIVGLATTGSLPIYEESLDVNFDGFVDERDVSSVLESIGAAPVPAQITSLLTLLATDPPPYLNTNFEGTVTTPIEDYGLIGCLVCAIRCAKALADAADCVDNARDWLEQCLEDACGNYWEIVACYEGRIAHIETCLDDIIAATPQCAQCIRKCGPTVG